MLHGNNYTHKQEEAEEKYPKRRTQSQRGRRQRETWLTNASTVRHEVWTQGELLLLLLYLTLPFYQLALQLHRGIDSSNFAVMRNGFSQVSPRFVCCSLLNLTIAYAKAAQAVSCIFY